MSAPPILGRELTAAVRCGPIALGGAELLARACGAARQLAGARRVAVDSAEPLHQLCWLLGADLAGAAALLGPEPGVLADAAPDRIVRGLPEPAGPVAPRGDERTWFYLATTSGSSGAPRVLVRSRRSWLRSFTALGVGLEPSDVVLVPGPLSSSLHLFGALHALHQDREVRLLARWSALEAAEQCRSATVVHVVPAMLAALVAVWERRPELRADCRLRLIVCGGSAVDPSLERRLRAVLPGCELLEYYGAAETSLIALRRGEARLRPVVDVDVLDRQGNPSSEGLLRVRSELVFDGHLRAGELVPREDPVAVGDLVVRHDDGTLRVLGRAGGMLDSGGALVAPEEVEGALRGPGVLDVVVAGSPHPRLGALVTAVVELDPGAPATRAQLRGRAHALAPAKRPRRWLTGVLPRTPSGKPARAGVAEGLRTGSLAAEELR